MSETVTEGEDVSSTSYEYDSVGNMTKETTDDMTVVYEYNNLNQLVRKYDPDGYSYGRYSWGYGYAYDDYGNLKSVTNLASYKNEYSVSSDINGKVQSATRNINANGVNNATITNTYDATGNNVKTRTQKTLINKQTDVTVTRIYDYTEEVPKVLAEYGTDGTMKKYIYGAKDERIVASVKTNMVYNFGIKSYTLHSDRLGSTRWATDIEGNIAAETEYDIWGKVKEAAGIYISTLVEAADITSSYTGYSYDSTLEWWNSGARMYDPQNKRFISRDPKLGNVYEPVRVNSYIYAGNNPLKYIDPNGKSFIGDVINEIGDFVQGVRDTFQEIGCKVSKAIAEMSVGEKILLGVGLMGAGMIIGGVPFASAASTMFSSMAVGGAFGAVSGGAGVLAEGALGYIFNRASAAGYVDDVVPDGVRGVESGNFSNVYIPMDADGNPIPLRKQNVMVKIFLYQPQMLSVLIQF